MAECMRDIILGMNVSMDEGGRFWNPTFFGSRTPTVCESNHHKKDNGLPLFANKMLGLLFWVLAEELLDRN